MEQESQAMRMVQHIDLTRYLILHCPINHTSPVYPLSLSPSLFHLSPSPSLFPLLPVGPVYNTQPIRPSTAATQITLIAMSLISEAPLLDPLEVSSCSALSCADTTPSEGEPEDYRFSGRCPNIKSKEKSELCNKFMAHGFCPYGSLCKFAHGSYQLRQNNRTNNRYKTKRCEAFFRDSYCGYGERCNFQHKAAKRPEDEELKWKEIFRNNRECVMGARDRSRLLRLLGEE